MIESPFRHRLLASILVVGLSTVIATQVGCAKKDRGSASIDNVSAPHPSPVTTSRFVAFIATNDADELPDAREIKLPDGQIAYAANEPLVTDADVESVRLRRRIWEVPNSDNTLSIYMRPEAKQELLETTERHVGDLVVFYWDNQLLYGARIMSKLPNLVVLGDEFTKIEYETLQGMSQYLESLNETTHQ